MHHQGVFRVPGSQAEISNFKEAFEYGEDPLVGLSDARDINSTAGLLKLYFRELGEPPFPKEVFMELVKTVRESKLFFFLFMCTLANAWGHLILISGCHQYSAIFWTCFGAISRIIFFSKNLFSEINQAKCTHSWHFWSDIFIVTDWRNFCK